MKRQTILLALAFISIFSFSQTTKDIFKADMYTFYGVDFSEAKFIGRNGFNNIEKIQNIYIPFWNRLFIDEARKYNLKKIYRVPFVKVDVDSAIQRAKRLNLYKKLSEDNNYMINKDIVKKVVATYKFPNNNGIGILYVVESFNFNMQEAVIWVAFFDIKTGKLLLTQRIRGGVYGLNFRNWWARGIYNVMKKSGNYYPQWESEYNR